MRKLLLLTGITLSLVAICCDLYAQDLPCFVFDIVVTSVFVGIIANESQKKRDDYDF
jgi:hypothetical protein